MSKGSIVDPRVRIVASKKLCDYVQKHLGCEKNLPESFAKICGKISKASLEENNVEYPRVAFTEEEKKLLVEAEKVITEDAQESGKEPQKPKKEQILTVQDVKWLNRVLQEKRKEEGIEVYLHELLEHSTILLPENSVIERNPELEKRCEALRKEQENKVYRKMTRNVENPKNVPYEDTISYQIKQINKQLIAVAQFIFSVIAGFVFGFLGIQLIVGNLDFGFRLLLGIMFALIIALAEIYFLAKKLNENADEFKVDKSPEHRKTAPSTPEKTSGGEKEHRD
ncbi:transmembrane protein 199 [Lutzomyia longipalpis]|uniref:transmembrane protein 199 n=1 Tax=Lutzomyia longipalpis TaxID=7200 RepID=UPI002483BE44|nr:transmembrane protein 199 [Lutzomyia longipalpis]